MKLPPLNALRMFESAARKGSFVAAGEELGVTSAAVSLQVRTLEKWLGRELFFRRNNQIRLTDAGQELYRNAAQSLTQIATFTQSLQHSAPTRPFIISAVPSVADSWLSVVAAKLDVDFPIKLITAEDPFDLERGGVDVHISYGNMQYPEHVQTQLFLDQVSPMAAPRFTGTLSTGPFIEIDWGRNFATGPTWHRWFVHHGLTPPPPAKIIASHSSMALTLAQQGAGLVLGQHAMAQQALDDGRLQIIDPRALTLPSPYFAISGHHLQKNKRLITVLCHLQNVV